MCPGSKAFIGFSKGYVAPPPNSKNHCRDEEGAKITMAQTDGEELVTVVGLDLKTEG